MKNPTKQLNNKKKQIHLTLVCGKALYLAMRKYVDQYRAEHPEEYPMLTCSSFIRSLVEKALLSS